MSRLAILVNSKSTGDTYAQIGFYGLVISFIGALPIGTLNSTAFNIAASQGVSEAVWFALAAVFAELLIVRFTLAGNGKINFSGKASIYILSLAVLLLLYLSVSSFMAAEMVSGPNASTTLFPAIKSSILLGILLSFLNPLHIPFWMGWNRVLWSKNLLRNKTGSYASYMLGIGLGTLGALMLFVYAGKYIIQNYQQYNTIIAFTMGCLYLCFSFYLIFLLYKKIIKSKID
ncbi:LysE family transporter [Spongiimicrobium sp. 3-5]|uniref:LysE family transporter n=1 Tax=Spongiimicrobium sp. 3-5 TaxID=3332596 RepID=UPI00397ECE29